MDRAPRNGLRAWRALMLVVVWAGVGGTGASQASTGAAAGFTDSTAGIHLWAPMHEPGGRFDSQAAAVSAARRYDLITIRPGQLDGFAPAMRAANPRLEIYVYMNGSYLYKSQLGDVPAWTLARTADGDLIQSNGWGNYLGKPSNPGWITFKQHECATDIGISGADGCYLDMLGAAPTMPGYDTGLPIDPATGLVWTRVDWLTDTAALAAAVAGYSDEPVLSNGFGNGRRYFGSWAPSRILLDGALGSTAEGWLKKPGAPATAYESEQRWLKDVDMLGDVNARGRVALTMTKMWGGGTTAQKQAWRLYALASFLLGNNGHSYFYFSADRGEPATVDSPLYHLPIGVPLRPMAQAGGLYQRAFSNGLVLVNPTADAVTVALGGPYLTPAGDLVRTLTLDAESGQILTDG
jgi:Hypothetical glycosyl hydrolase family 15